MIELRGVSKTFQRGSTAVKAVDQVSFTIEAGQFVSIMGKSGSGKSTLLHLMSGLVGPTSGQVSLLGQQLASLSDDRLTQLRRERVGFVFQFFNLLPSLTAAENVALPLLLSKVKAKEADRQARQFLSQVGLQGRADHRPAELSGGQMQRVAIARALVHKPKVLFADEPTGNLDSTASEEILTLLKELKGPTTIVMVTHDPKAAAYGDRLITVGDGRIVDDLRLDQGVTA